MSRRRTAGTLFQSKEDTNFKEALKLYESKQYKKALKLVDTNLKKKSHPQSLALKGLLLYHIHAANGKNEDPDNLEPKSYFQKALKEDASNPVINHIIAIFYRALPDYTEAAKYYKLALDNGSENRNIWKDLAVSEIQLRKYKNALAARLQVLNYFQGYRANWTGLAITHHLNKNYDQAEKVLTGFEELAEGKLSDPEFVEHSECLLYKNKIIFESGDVKKALKNLKEIEKTVFDHLSVNEYRATYQTALGDHKAASITYRKLLQRNPDKTDYYYLLEASLGIEQSNITKRLKLYNKLEKFYPKSDPPKVIPLMFLKADSKEFEDKLKNYLISKLQRGVPSVFKTLKFLYKNPAKVQVIEKLVLEFLDDLAQKSKLDVDPTITVWTLYLLSQHYMFLGDISKAEEYIDKAMTHSPTLVELILFKANIAKHKGQLVEAADIVNSARLLDLQDRFINCKATKYYLRADNLEKAIEIASLFTKNDDAVNGLKDLHLMQANWYLIEESEAYFRLFKKAKNALINHLNKIDSENIEFTPELSREVKDEIDEVQKLKGLTLKRFNSVVKNYKEFENDQLDFHGYCPRKGTPRAYISMLNWADGLFNQPLFMRAVKGMSEVYLSINDDIVNREASIIYKYSEIIASSASKKSKNKNKNKTNKRREQEASKIIAYDHDLDVFGEQFVNTDEPIEKLNELFSLTTDKTSVFYLKLSFLIYIIQGKFILAFQSLKNAKDILVDPSQAILPYYLMKLVESLKNNTDPKLEAIKSMVVKSISSVFKDFNADESFDVILTKFFKLSEADGLENHYFYLKSTKLAGKYDEAVATKILELINKGKIDRDLNLDELVILKDYVEANGSEDCYWI
ncbi:peptide alpha-N-acetyltransferase complex A subunit [Saccharomycopsis crataegensis]|uniref:Peptide alpha-N-acetyltransferase complex A subunit n=1 Tax=Saccharomycopsis crataegensis TaxID=43959 RepID=A0AAV5QVM2_9ASCO|nr:peptide alpha-N-acetyltransferase complex A subunit [Saccharomycopsis crataegensis]